MPTLTLAIEIFAISQRNTCAFFRFYNAISQEWIPVLLAMPSPIIFIVKFIIYHPHLIFILFDRRLKKEDRVNILGRKAHYSDD